MQPLGYDPDWYDKGPGSESYKRKIRESQRRLDQEAWNKTTCPKCGQQWRISGPCKCVKSTDR